uniref:Nudix hydrolase domain-containing protein n=1 Tax=viral metagenome TaxID=1070528 RepID=A0A6C0LIP9_9ZZZZ
MGAGVLPICFKNGAILFLLGKEGYDKKWSDFGGGKEKKETPIDTAVREGCEELNGMLGSENDMRALISSHLHDKIEVDGYTTYIVEIPYDPLFPYYFNNNYKLMESKFPHLIGKKGMFEKSEIKWFTMNQFKRNKKHIRPFYKKIANKIIDIYKK